MRDITPLKPRMDTPESKAFWKHIEKTAKEVRKWPEWKSGLQKQTIISRYDIGGDKLVIKHKGLRTRIASLLEKYRNLTARASTIWQKQNELLQQMQFKCDHQYVLERTTSYRDEYDEWHNGYPERKCIDCFLVEKSLCDGYKKLDKSTVIELIMNQGEKIFSLEFEDLQP